MTEIYVIVILLLLGISIYIYWVYTRDTYIVRIKKNQIIEFKSSFDLTGLPIIVFYQGDKKYNFLIDSGSNITYINQDSDIERQMTDNKDVFMGANGSDISCQYANINLYRDNAKYEIKIAVANLNNAFAELKSNYGVQLTGIIGCDFMNKYKYCIDFKECIVYARG